MKTIGIKLADGSFYPILKEGTAEKKALNLTTVKDNQTTVQVDLYRSETESMQDAEYVDSLEIKHLVKHPNGEPDIALDISIDENNELKAELHDPETGKDSSTTVSLVSRTIEQRSEPSDVTIAETDGIENDDDNFEFDESLSPQLDDDDFSLDDDDFNFDPNSLNIDSLVEEPADGTDSEDTISDENSEPDEHAAAAAAGLGLLGAAAIASSNDSDTDTDSQDFSFDSTDTIQDEQLDMPDFSSSLDDTPAEDDTFTMADLPDDPFAEEETGSTTISDDDDFSIPDDFSLDDPFADSSDSETTVSDSDSEYSFSNSDSDKEDLSSMNNAGLDFSDILDEETKEGRASDSGESDETQKDTKVPVIICITCAVICIIAVLLILFVIPSKFNVVQKQDAETKIESVQTAEKQPDSPQNYDAKENEIVVAPAEKILPEVVQNEKPVPSKNITYKIKWGDTLWDISKAYYHNPWKYQKIAKYNNIKNPDHIISGTTIIIPAE